MKARSFLFYDVLITKIIYSYTCVCYFIFFSIWSIYIDTSSTKSSPDLPSLLPFSTTSAIFLVFQGKKNQPSPSLCYCAWMYGLRAACRLLGTLSSERWSFKYFMETYDKADVYFGNFFPEKSAVIYS